MAEKNPRRAAVEALVKVHREGGYSNIVLDTLLRNTAFSPQDKALVSRLFYGVIERKITLDFIISERASMPIKRMHPAVLEILRCAVYQIQYMDKIPPSAAVNEAVKLTKSMGQAHAAGFVNALLRTVLREKETLLANLPTDAAGESIRYSVPVSLIDCWQKSYGADVTRELLTVLNTPPVQSIRVNTLKMSTADFCARLTAAGVPFTAVPDLPDNLHIPAGFDWKGLAKIEENCYYYQDTASQYCCLALDAQPGETVADVCAAPGGKSFTLAQRMQNRGKIVSGDIYPQKCETVARRAATLGITCIETVTRDASEPIPAVWRGAFDRVLCDAPCSGLGVIRRKPEIRYKSTDDAASLPALQRKILCRCAEMVKPGGVLQYSTCTLRPEENERVAEAFLQEHPNFSPRTLPLPFCFERAGRSMDYRITLFPHIQETDGFFIASFQKNA